MNKQRIYYLELGQMALLFVLLHYFLENQIYSYVGLGVVVLGLLIWQVRFANGWVWSKINKVTQAIGEFVLLFVIYFLIVTPIGWAFQLKNRKKHNQKSTLVAIEKPFTADELRKTW